MDVLLEPLIVSWSRSLRARNVSQQTLRTYLTAARQLDAHLRAGGYAGRPEDLRRADIEDYIASLYEAGRKPTTVSNRFRALQQFFLWAEDEDEVPKNPMAKMQRPIVPEQEVPLLTGEEITKLLRVCAGKAFPQRRDLAIVLMFIDTGMRRAELAGVTTDDLDLDNGIVHVVGKGRRPRACVFGRRTTEALDRYVRLRARQPGAPLPSLWLNETGRKELGYYGVGQMLERRGKAAGIERLHPHRFRHQNAHEFLVAGGTEGDLMRVMGWKSASMTRRYGASGADARARESARQRSLADRL